MSYYSTCSFCGDNLDPGEHCNCRQKADAEKSKPVKIKYPEERKRPRYAG